MDEEEKKVAAPEKAKRVSRVSKKDEDGRVELRHPDGRTIRVKPMHVNAWRQMGFKKVEVNHG